MKPTENKTQCETTENVLGYRDLLKKDAPLWKKLTCNELGCLSQAWEKYAGTDTIDFILHKEKPKYIKATYVREVYEIRLKKQETNRKILTVGGNLIDYSGEVNTPTPNLTNMKMHVNRIISDIK